MWYIDSTNKDAKSGNDPVILDAGPGAVEQGLEN
jgi:hypothetical protein